VRISIVAALAFLAHAATAQTIVFDAGQIGCDEFRALISEAEAGSSELRPLQAAAYQMALLDAFDWYFGRSSIQREWSRVIQNCDTTLFDAAETLSENVFYEFESELRMQIEYESE
jgi:hypothetical protein